MVGGGNHISTKMSFNVKAGYISGTFVQVITLCKYVKKIYLLSCDMFLGREQH